MNTKTRRSFTETTNFVESGHVTDLTREVLDGFSTDLSPFIRGSYEGRGGLREVNVDGSN